MTDERESPAGEGGAHEEDGSAQSNSNHHSGEVLSLLENLVGVHPC